MKKLGAILTLAALMVLLSANVVFAGSLTIDETYPRDGSKGASIENLGVKIYFSNDMSEEVVGEANKNCFGLYDQEGNELPIKVLYNDNEHGVVLVLLDTASDDTVKAQSNTEYTLKISGDVIDDQGNSLGKDTSISFKTLNQSTNTWISMGMMVVMFGGMIIVSSRAARKNAEEEKKKRDEKVNPYKEAKKTGKSVEEIVEKDQKRKEKLALKEARQAEEEDYYYEEEDINRYKVKKRHSASQGGSKYVAKKKAMAAEAKAKAEKYKNNSKKNKKKK
jgi:hypothetical protein